MNQDQPEKPTARELINRALEAVRRINEIEDNDLRIAEIKREAEQLGIAEGEFRRLLRAR
jgi:hypothetical protein